MSQLNKKGQTGISSFWHLGKIFYVFLSLDLMSEKTYHERLFTIVRTDFSPCGNTIVLYSFGSSGVQTGGGPPGSHTSRGDTRAEGVTPDSVEKNIINNKKYIHNKSSST